MRTQFPLTPFFSRIAVMALVLPVLFGLATLPARAADHRDSPTADGAPQGDITDFAFLDPGNSNNVVLIMDVNPFLRTRRECHLQFFE